MYEVEADSLRHEVYAFNDCLPWHNVMFDEERRKDKDDGRRMNLRSLRTDNE